MAMAFTAITLFGYKNEEGFTIRGKITGAKEGSKIIFSYADIRSGNDQLGTVLVKNGEFEFKGKLASPRLLSMNVRGGAKSNAGTCFFAENTDMTIEASVDDLLDWSQAMGTGSSDKVNITGSKSQDLYNEFYQKAEVFNKQISTLSHDNIIELYKEKGMGRAEATMPPEFGLGMSKKIDALAKEKKTFEMNFVLNNKPSEVISYIAIRTCYENVSVSEIDQLVKHIASSTEKGLLANQFLQSAAKARMSAIGASFMDYTLQDPQGNSHKLSDYRKKGHYLLLEFWASWCGHCRASFPHLKTCYEKYHAKGFDVVAISLDSKTELWNEAMQTDGVTGLWPQLSDLKAYQGEIPKAYNINGLPTSILLDPDGKVVTRNMRGAWMENILINKFGNQ